METTAFRILLLLSKKDDHHTTPRQKIIDTLGISRSEYDAANVWLSQQNYVSNGDPNSIMPQGRAELNKILEVEKDRFENTMNDKDFPFALIEFVYHRGIVGRKEFPDYIIDYVPNNGMQSLGSVLQVVIDNSQYIKEVNQKTSLTSLGKKYYETKTSKIETPHSTVVDQSMHFHGDGNIFAPDNKGEIKGAKIQKNVEDGETKDLNKKLLGLTKKQLTWTIISIVVAIFLWWLSQQTPAAATG